MDKEHKKKISEGLKEAHARGAYLNVDRTKHGQNIREHWINGDYDNRDASYRNDENYLNQISDSLKLKWKEGVFGKERNKKISDAHKGKPKPWLRKPKIEYIKICEYVECKKEFTTKNKDGRFCSKSCSSRGVKRTISPEKEKIRRQKISAKLKGRMPKNLQYNITNNNSYRQKDMYNIIKEYFPKAEENFYVKTKKTKRWLDTAVIELQIDFEYDGMIHLRKDVQENDRIREEELKDLGWRIIRFDRNNFNTIREVLTKIIKENGDVYTVGVK